ncbi:MAG: hypothetical protein N2Z21_01965 [Candidatus Sumerlaeaceae bacterium]|nr:hypothetical protein [Candidatus Sumerlaeaceae bacterium]
MVTSGVIAVVGSASVVAGVVAGYVAWRKIGPSAAEEKSSPKAALPLIAGVAAGSLAMLFFLPAVLAPRDRFYTERQALQILAAVNASTFLLFGVYYLERIRSLASSWHRRLFLRLVIELLACLVVIAAGVRFTVLSPIPGKEIPLEGWAWLATLVWMLVAMNTVKLLDGIEGAASILLLVASVAIFYTTWGTEEYFLQTFAIALGGASLASLRFTAYPARWSLRGPGSSVAGFVFAVLTVLARQKSVAALLFIFPLALVLIVLAGAVLSGLERILFSDRDQT